MKGNINPFSGDKCYQTTKGLLFRNRKTEESYQNDQFSRNRYALICLCALSLFLMLWAYFANSCYDKDSQNCTHQYLFMVNFVGYFFLAYKFSQNSTHYNQNLCLLSLMGIFNYVKMLEDFEAKIALSFMSAHMTVISYFLIYHWKTAILFESVGYFATFGYIRIYGDRLINNLFYENKEFLSLNVFISIFLLSLSEKVQKEKWVLFDSFKRSEKLLECFIESIDSPIFLLDEQKKILLRNKAAREILEENHMPLFLPVEANSFFSLFPDEKTQNNVNNLIDNILYHGQIKEKGLFFVNSRANNMEKKFSDKRSHEQFSFSLENRTFLIALESFVWKGLRCILVEFKEEKGLDTLSYYNEVLGEKALVAITKMLVSQFREKELYFDSLMQNIGLMESKHDLNRRIFSCYRYIFALNLLRNLLSNNLDRILVENPIFYDDFLPSEMLGLILQVNKPLGEKHDISLDISSFENDRSSLNLNYSDNLSNDKNLLLVRSKSSSKNFDNIPLHGPSIMLQFALITVIRAVIKFKMCKKIILSYKLEAISNEDQEFCLVINITFEQPCKEEALSNSQISRNMFVGDMLLNTVKDYKRLQEFLADMLKIDNEFTLDTQNRFEILRAKTPKNLSIFLLPFIFSAISTQPEVIIDDDFNRRVTRLQMKCQMKKSKADFGTQPLMKTAFFDEKKSEVEKETPSIIQRKKPILAAKSVFSFEYFGPKAKVFTKDQLKMMQIPPQIHEERKHDDNNQLFAEIKRSNSKELSKEMIFKATNPLNKMPSHKSLKDKPPDIVLTSNYDRKRPPLKSFTTIKKSEIFIEEEVKKYLHHLQNGFSLTVENVLNDLLNNEAYKDAKIIFPPKKLLFEEKKKPIHENHKRQASISPSNKFPTRPLNIPQYQEKDEKDEVSSFLFTESNRTESAQTNKSNEEEVCESNPFSKNIQKTKSNQLKARTLTDNRMFRSPNLRVVPGGAHGVLPPRESLLKYVHPPKKNMEKNNEFSPKSSKFHPNAENMKTFEEFQIFLKKRENDTSIRIKNEEASRNSHKGNHHQKNDIRELTYTRRWVIYKDPHTNQERAVTEINCALSNNFGEKSLDSSTFPKFADEKKVFIRKFTKKPKSLISDTKLKTKDLTGKLKEKKNQNVLNNIKRFEEIKQEDEQNIPKNIFYHKYNEILASLTYKEKPTILAFDSESSASFKEHLKCKGVKSLALKVGHDYKFDLCSTGADIIKNYKSFIRKSLLYHLIIIEIEMPGMEGWKCVRKIRNFEAKYRTKHRSFICALLNDDQTDYELYIRWGIDEFLRKPFNSELFEGILQRKLRSIQDSEEKDQGKLNKVVNSEYEALKSGFNEIIDQALKAEYQKEPLLMLTIDDNNFILMGMCHLKSKIKYRMEISKSGNNGLNVYRDFLAKGLLFHIIFIDIDMPEMDGLEVTKLIRQLERELSLKRSFICGLITDENNKFDVYHEVGMDEFLKKPVNLQVFNELIERRVNQIVQESLNGKVLQIGGPPLPIIDESPVKDLKNAENKPKLLDFEINGPLNLREMAYFLAIDDNDFILIGISHLKLSIPYKMDIAKGGSLGLEKYKAALKRNERFHAIFIDIDMPEIDGLAVIKAIRSIEKEYNLENVLACALITEDNKDFDGYMEAGFNELLKKPVNPKAMEHIIEKIAFLNKKNSNEKKDDLILEKKNPKNENAIATESEMKNNLNISVDFKPEITLLTVDDNDFILMGMSHMRLDFKYKMEICKNGALAIEKYQTMRKAGFIYHAIFIDIDMPIMNGIECTKKIRELEQNLQETKKSYIVGLINDDYKDIEHYLEIGMNEFLNKPVNPKLMNSFLKKRVEEISSSKQDLPKNEEKKSMNDLNIPKKTEGENFHYYPECTLMAVDDNDFILMGISHLKCPLKYKFELAKNGKIALEKYYKHLNTHHLFHIIFMDIDMPEMDGLSCTKKIRDLEKTQNIQRTFIVGLINDDFKEIEKYLEVGMDEFINKPVNPNAFSALLQKRMEELQKKQEKLLEKSAISEGQMALIRDEDFQNNKLGNLIKTLEFAKEITLLAIDDNDFILIGISHLKLDIKYKMEIAKSGKKGFEKYQDYLQKGLMFHAIFIDIDMPEISGLQLTSMIREFEKNSKIPDLNSYIVGLITDENKAIESYIEAGMNEFLNKPVNPKSMNNLLQQRISKLNEKSRENNLSPAINMEPKGKKHLKYNEEMILMLAIDDNDFILINISHLKIREGNVRYKMEISRSGKDGFEKYQKSVEKGLVYHCLFIDIEMPIMNGLDLARKIREYEKMHEIEPRSLICGLVTEDTVDFDLYKEAGMDEFLNKPVNPISMTKFLEEKKII